MGNPKKKKKNQLPSGSYRVQVYDYTDADGKKHYKSFTAASKKLAQMAAAQWQANKEHQRDIPENLTVYEAITRYLGVKKGVLSPATLRGYENLQKNYFRGYLGTLTLSDIRDADIQLWLSDLSARLSPKTVNNAYGLLLPTLRMFNRGYVPDVTLPQKNKPQLYCPNDNDVKKLLQAIKGTELELAVLLAAFGPLRRGEIAALTAEDISGNYITVNKEIVKGPDNCWHTKIPKTTESIRKVEFPSFVVERFKGRTGQLVRMNPDYITHRFGRVLKKLDIPHFRFHDLRHYSASIMHALGVPDQYILQRGGWRTDGVMKRVYRDAIDTETVKQNAVINSHFDSMIRV